MGDNLTFYFTLASGTPSVTFQPFVTGAKTLTTSLNGAVAVTQTLTGNTPFSIVLSTVGTNTIVIAGVAGAGTLDRITIQAEPDLLTRVLTNNTATWGLGGAVSSFASMFSSSAALVAVPAQIPSTVTSLSDMFNGCTSFIGTDGSGAIAAWTCTNVTNMSNMFNGCNVFNAPIGNWNTASVTTMANMFTQCPVFNQTLNWQTPAVTTMASMFNGCTAFNNNGVAMTWSTTSLVANMSFMFSGCANLNVDLSSFDTASVTNMQGMFNGCTIFNQDISNWNVTVVSNMDSMFSGALAFNAPIKYWSQPALLCTFTTMFSSPSAFQTAYYPFTPGYDVTPTAPARSYFGQTRPTRYPCFMKGTQILCLRGEEEVYLPIQNLRKGDLVKTYRNGYLPIHMIGTSSLSNPGDEERTTNRLYKCSKELYPSLFEDLYITGCHSILVPALTNDQWENTKDMLGNVYVTDNHFRLMACLDEKAQPFQRDAMIDIFHIALENEDYYMNYGVYANGLLVETCSKRYLTELSNMRIIGEDEACYDAPSVNVFSELSGFIQC